MILDIETFEKFSLDKEKKQTQENFTQNYDEAKVIDVKALGLVKKREKKDMEKLPIQTENKVTEDGDKYEEQITHKEVKLEKGTKIIGNKQDINDENTQN